MIVLGCITNACSPLGALNAIVPTAGYTLHKNIHYGDNAKQMLDVYVPDVTTENTPTIVFFYGGSWQWGTKDDYLFAAQGLVSLGYIVVIPNYRLYPEVRYPEFLDDSAHAVAWVFGHAQHYRMNPEHVYLMGHSAGAYNAVSLALNEHYLKKAAIKSSSIRGVIGLAGPYDFLPFTDPNIIAIFASEPDSIKTQPIHYVRKNTPPMLLLTGNADETVWPKNSRNLYHALKTLDNDVTLTEYEGVGHYGIAAGLATPIDWNSQVRADIAEFISKH